MSNLNQGASIEAVSRDKFYALREEYEAYMADRCAQAMGIPFATWAARRTPAAAAGAGELPPLPIAQYKLSPDSKPSLHDDDAMQNYARAAIEADRAQRKQAALQEIIDIGQEIEQGAPSVKTWQERMTDAGESGWAPHSFMADEIADLRAQLARSEESVGQYQQNVLELAEELRGARAQLAAKGQGEPKLMGYLYGDSYTPAAEADEFMRGEGTELFSMALGAPASAQPADPKAMSNAEAATWARENGLNVPPQWEAGAQPDQRESAAALNGVIRYTVYTNCHHSDGHEIVPEPDGDYILYADAVAALAASPAAQPAKDEPELCQAGYNEVEALAKQIYAAFPGAADHPWVEHGNSDKQCEARRMAMRQIQDSANNGADEQKGGA